MRSDVVERSSGIHHLYHVTVSVHIDHPPQLSPGVHPTEEHSLVLTIDSEHHVSSTAHVVVHHRVLVCELLRQSLGPEPVLVGEVRTRVLGKISRQEARINGGESEPDGSRPTVRLVHEPDEDLLIDSDRSVSEHDGFAETLNPRK